MKVPSIFTQKVWHLAISIPPGRITTYGRIAKAAGGGGQAARSISSILAKSPQEYRIPWHRIVYSSGKVWTNNKIDEIRMNLYLEEGIDIDKNGKIKNFQELLWEFH